MHMANLMNMLGMQVLKLKSYSNENKIVIYNAKNRMNKTPSTNLIFD